MVQIRCGLIALLVWCVGCASALYVPESPAPNPEHIQQLMQSATVPESVKEMPFSLQLNPEIGVIFEGGAIWVTCYVPRSYNKGRRVRIAVEGVMSSDHPLDRAEHKFLVEHIPCGHWVATCQVAEGMVHRDITVQGASCDGAQ